MDIKSSIHMVILSFIRNLTSSWSQMNLTLPLTPAMCYTQFGGSSSSPNLVAIENSWTIWPMVEQRDGSILTKSPRCDRIKSVELNVASRGSWSRFILLPWLTLADLCMTFDPINALHFGQWFYQLNLVAIGHFWAIWPLVSPSWPLRDLWT